MDDWFGLQRGLVAVGLLAAIPGCSDSDKDKATDTDPGSTSATDGPVTATGTTGGTTGDAPTGTGSATDSGSDTTGGTTGGTDGTTGEATTGEATTGGVEIPPVCQSYGAKVAECYMDPMAGMDATQYCAIALMAYETYGPDCVQANEAWLACLSALPCEEFTGDNPVCEAESATLESACAGP